MDNIENNLSYIPLSTPYIQNIEPQENEFTAQFKCRICGKTFYNQTALQNHRKLQHDSNSTCDDVEQANNVKSIADENSKDVISCFNFIPLESSCDDNLVLQEDGTIVRDFSEDRTYLIVKTEVDKVFGVDDVKRRRLEGLVKRAKMKPGKRQPVDLRGPFTCTFPSALRPEMQCRKIFFNCCEYSVHYRELHTKRRKAALRCQVCEKRLDNDPYKGITMSPPVTPISNFFSCHLCQQTFTTASEYDEHNRTMHIKVKPHQCSICNKRFTQQGGLQQHMRMHSGIRPFVCTFCSKAFTQKAGLDQHLRTHTKIKPFKCVVCFKAFSQSVHLRQHMRTHTNIQPFECSFCGKRFKQSSHLNFHLRSHVGDTTAILIDRYSQLAEVQPAQNHMDYLNLANIRPVDYGNAMYYTADMDSATLNAQPISFGYEPHVMPPNVMSM